MSLQEEGYHFQTVKAVARKFIDDREENILAAQQIGMRTILFEQNKQAIAALQGLLTI